MALLGLVGKVSAGTRARPGGRAAAPLPVCERGFLYAAGPAPCSQVVLC